MFSSNARIGQPVTFGQALGGQEGQPLELNSAQAATCPRCGLEPRLYHHVSPKGRDVTIWIPAEHHCARRR